MVRQVDAPHVPVGTVFALEKSVRALGSSADSATNVPLYLAAEVDSRLPSLQVIEYAETDKRQNTNAVLGLRHEKLNREPQQHDHIVTSLRGSDDVTDRVHLRHDTHSST